MQKLKHLLYSLLFIYSSLYSSNIEGVYDDYNENVHSDDWDCSNVNVGNTKVYGPYDFYGDDRCSDQFGSSHNFSKVDNNDGFEGYTYTITECTNEADGNGYDFVKHYVYTRNCYVSSCNDDEVLNDDGVCEVPSCLDEDTILPNMSESNCQGSLTIPASNGTPATSYSNLYWQTCDSTCRGTSSNTFDCNPNTYPLKDNQRLHIGAVPQAVGSKTPTPSGYVLIDSFDETCSYTIFTFFECPRDNIYNRITDLCDVSPNDFPSDEACSAGYGKRQFLDFSGVGYFDSRYSEMGAEIKHCYELYSCKSDYTISKLQEVSCSEYRKINEVTIVPHDDNSSADWSVSFKPYNSGSKGGDGSGTTPNPLGSDYNFSSKSDFDIVNNYNSSGSLDSIDKSLKGQDENGSKDGSIGADFSDGIGFINGVKDGASAFANDITSIKDKLSTGFVASNVNTGSAPVFTGNVFGKETTISMCGSLSYFASAFYYVFSLLFTWYGIVLYYLGFKQRG